MPPTTNLIRKSLIKKFAIFNENPNFGIYKRVPSKIDQNIVVFFLRNSWLAAQELITNVEPTDGHDYAFCYRLTADPVTRATPHADIRLFPPTESLFGSNIDTKTNTQCFPFFCWELLDREILRLHKNQPFVATTKSQGV